MQKVNKVTTHHEWVEVPLREILGSGLREVRIFQKQLLDIYFRNGDDYVCRVASLPVYLLTKEEMDFLVEVWEYTREEKERIIDILCKYEDNLTEVRWPNIRA